MNTLAEIEAAIEKLPTPQFAELALWWERRHSRPGFGGSHGGTGLPGAG